MSRVIKGRGTGAGPGVTRPMPATQRPSPMVGDAGGLEPPPATDLPPPQEVPAPAPQSHAPQLPPTAQPSPAPAPPAPPRSRPGVIDREEVQARSQAHEIVQRAQSDARMIRGQAEEFRQRGYEEGYAAGHEEGKAQLTETILTLNRETEARWKEIEPDMIRLAVRVAEKIIGHSLETDPDVIIQIVAEALTAARHQREIYVRVNPADYETVVSHKRELVDQLSRARDIDVRSDPNVTAGGCLVDSEVGTIDATLESQLSVLERILLGSD